MSWIEAVGWLGNACFFSRFLIQWVRVERARDRAAPRIFWLLSVAGSLLLGTYAVGQRSWILLVGFAVNSLIYLRNLALGSGSGTGDAALPRLLALALALGALAALAVVGVSSARREAVDTAGWILIAILGQALWSSRFVVQWWYSEKSRNSHFPPAFWTASLFGNVLLLSYAVHLQDAVFVAGLAFGPLVQIRNLVLTRRSELDAKGGYRSSE